MKNKIAWGTSKLLKIYLENGGRKDFLFCVDDFSAKKDICGIPIKKSSSISDMKKMGDKFQIVIFAVSSRSLQQISEKLNKMGLNYKKDFIYYSDFFYDKFKRRLREYFNIEMDEWIYRYALSFTLNTRVLMETTILGMCLFLELMKKSNKLRGEMAEVGIFQGANSLGALNLMPFLNKKKFYLFDSFEGFPEISVHDPNNIKKSDHNIETTFQEIQDDFSIFPNAVLIKGFIPEAFKKVPKKEKFSLVFFDCDLYQPALDTFKFFWDKMESGGYLIIHDYEVEKGGFEGVKKATKEFFDPKKVKIYVFPETTMAVVKKK